MQRDQIIYRDPVKKARLQFLTIRVDLIFWIQVIRRESFFVSKNKTKAQLNLSTP